MDVKATEAKMSNALSISFKKLNSKTNSVFLLKRLPMKFKIFQNYLAHVSLKVKPILPTGDL